MASKFVEASCSDCPPERNTIPGTAAGTLRWRDLTVNSAISCGVAGPASLPARPETNQPRNQTDLLSFPVVGELKRETASC